MIRDNLSAKELAAEFLSSAIDDLDLYDDGYLTFTEINKLAKDEKDAIEKEIALFKTRISKVFQATLKKIENYQPLKRRK